MTHFNEKMRLVYRRFFEIALIIDAGYSFLYWYYHLHLNQLQGVREEIFQFLIPFLLSIVPAFIWLWPRIKLFDIKHKKRGKPDIAITIFAVFLMTVLTIVTLLYVSVMTGKLSPLQRIEQVKPSSVTKYYSFEKLTTIPRYTAYYMNTSGPDRGSSKKEYHLYAAVPIYNTSELTAGEFYYWVGFQSSKKISVNENAADRDQLLQELKNELQEKVNQFNNSNVQFYERPGNTGMHANYNKAIKNEQYQQLGYGENSYTVFLPHYENFANRGRTNLIVLIGVVAGVALIWLAISLGYKFDEQRLRDFLEQKGQLDSSDRFS